jgi:heme oxygenase
MQAKSHELADDTSQDAVGPDPSGEPFTARIRSATWPHHERAAASRFMGELVAGRLDRAAYADLVAQHWFVYRVLEEAAATHRSDPVAGRFVVDGLERVGALEADLLTLVGPRWAREVTASDATIEYCDRMRAVCFDWPGGFVAHHYTRYLGDLSGGQIIRRALERAYERRGEAGIAFYVFDDLGDLDAFKQQYRANLDAAPWDAAEQTRVIDEMLVAYDHNERVLAELDRAYT